MTLYCNAHDKCITIHVFLVNFRLSFGYCKMQILWRPGASPPADQENQVPLGGPLIRLPSQQALLSPRHCQEFIENESNFTPESRGLKSSRWPANFAGYSTVFRRLLFHRLVLYSESIHNQRNLSRTFQDHNQNVIILNIVFKPE